MSNKADNYFAIIPHWILFADISPQAIRLYCVLRTYADNKTLESWPSRQTLAEDMRVDSTKTVDRSIKELIDLGAIKVERRYKNGEPQSNLYTLMSQVAPQKSLPTPTDVPTYPQESPTNYNQLTKTKNTGAPNGAQIKELMQAFFDNYTGEIQPARSKMAGHLQQVFNEMPFERLKQLVIKVAIDGKEVTRSTLLYAAREPKTQATPTPPKFDPAEYERPDAKPMPSEVRDAILKGIGRDMSDFEAENESE